MVIERHGLVKVNLSDLLTIKDHNYGRDFEDVLPNPTQPVR